MSNPKYQLEQHPEFGYLFVSPPPSIEEISSYYKNEFYSTERPSFNDSQLDVQQEDQEFYNFWRNHIITQVTKDANRPISTFSCFDIGCGWGETLRYLKAKGANAFGVDPAPEAIEFCRSTNINARISDFTQLNPFDQKFDFVILQNVLEHLNGPDAIIDTINAEAIVDEGYLIIDVPNEFNAFQEAGREIHNLEQWWICPPAHLNYFSASSLEKLLTKKGYSIIDKISSFPLEMFLLFGEKYVGDSTLGRQCHLKRVAFEQNLIKTGKHNTMLDFYRSLAQQDLGRQTLIIAKKNKA